MDLAKVRRAAVKRISMMKKAARNARRKARADERWFKGFCKPVADSNDIAECEKAMDALPAPTSSHFLEGVLNSDA